MLSPGTLYQRVPKDLRRNLLWRRFVLQKAKGDPRLQRALREYCARDFLFFTSTFIIQYNPKDAETGEVSPFNPWECQERWSLETMRQLFHEQDDMLWEKSREMGATWLILIICLWACLFHSWKSFLFISHSEEAVEKAGKRNTLFWKVEFMLRHVPDWLKGRVVKRKLSFNFLDTDSSLEGSATTERSGVGGRNTAVILDEFSKHQKAQEILGQTADTGPCLFIGTHYGTGTAFYELTQRPDLKKVVMHWTSHPEKRAGLYRYHKATNRVEILDKEYPFPPDYSFVMDGHPVGGPFPGVRSPWYDWQCRRRKSIKNVAMHLDINPSGSVDQFFEPLRILDLKEKHARPPEWVGTIRYGKDGVPEKEHAFHQASDGPLRLWIPPRPDGTMPPGRYKVGADVSMGQGATLSTLSVGNARLGQKVAEFGDSMIDPLDFAVYAVALCWLFCDQDGNPAQLVWEEPGPGQKFGMKVVELGFRRLYYHKIEHDVKQKEATKPGWTNTKQSFVNLMLEYQDALYTGALVNPSKDALEECLNFKFTPEGWVEHSRYVSLTDPRGARQNHGDQTVADALMWMLCRGKAVKAQVKDEQEVPFMSLAWRRRERKSRERQQAGGYGWSVRRG